MSKTLPPPRLVTLVYAERDDSVLLLKRKRWPYAGYWVAPGGKIEPGEAPHAGALRELYEETGLRAGRGAAELRAVVHETAPRDDWQWLMFVYRVRDVEGDVVSDEREGELRWFAHADVDVDALLIPDSDRLFMPQVLGDEPGVAEFSAIFDDALRLTGFSRFG